MLRSFRILMAPDDGGTAGGLGGEGGQAGAQGGASDSGGGTGSSSGGAGGTNSSSGGESVGPEWAKGWEGVEAELLSDPSLKAIQNPASLLKSYVHAQRMQGRDKVILPGKTSTKEEVDQFWQKVGVPLEEGKYAEAFKYNKEGDVLGEEIGKEFIKQAHSLRVQPENASKLYEFFNTQSKANQERGAAAHEQKMQEGLDALQAKLGNDAYSVKLTKATNFLKENAPPAFMEFLGKSGLGKNPAIVEAFMTMADKLNKEETIPGGTEKGGQTIDDLNREINTMMGDMKGPYHVTSHPDHKRQVDHMLNLQTKLENARTRL